VHDSIAVGGVEVIGDAAITWDPRFRGIVVTTDASERIGVSSVASPIAVARVGRELQIVDAGRGGIVTLDFDGGEVDFRRHRLRIREEAAALTPLGWVVGGFGPDGAFTLFRSEQDSRALWSSTDFSSDPDLRPVISYQSPNLIVANRRSPFVLHTLEVGATLTPQGRIELGDILQDPSTWVLAGVVSIPGAYIVTLADVASDRRLMVILSQAGEVLRTRELDDPLVLLSRHDSGRILGARYVGATEIVEYSLADSISS
jgi:hypothetical protein